MIDKLYNLKKLQTDQQVLAKQQLLAKISQLEDDIDKTVDNLNSASVSTLGAISDFKVLEMHKNTMKEHISKLNRDKTNLLKQVDKYNEIIIELNKETEQFKYIKEQMKKEKFNKMIKDEETTSSEYMQAKWIAS